MSDKPEVKRRIRRLFQTLVIGSGALATLSACGDSNPQPQTPGTPATEDGGTATPKQGGSGFW
jgi:hypothetical protein